MLERVSRHSPLHEEMSAIESRDRNALRRPTQQISGLSKAFLARPVDWWTDREKSPVAAFGRHVPFGVRPHLVICGMLEPCKH